MSVVLFPRLYGRAAAAMIQRFVATLNLTRLSTSAPPMSQSNFNGAPFVSGCGQIADRIVPLLLPH